MSGAGRSTAAKSLEDLDWFVADNLPPDLLPTMLDLARRAKSAVPRLAAVVDVRSRAFSTDLKSVIGDLDTAAIRPYVVFLEASDETLVRRFDSVRRPHPLQEGGRVVVRAAFGVDSDTALRLNVVSFGFKYGLPVDADMVADCRFLPNPHWVADLAPLTGQDQGVRDYVLGQPGAAEFLDAYVEAVRVTLPGYQQEGKHFVMLAVGCAGGKHRSVVVAEEIAARLAVTWSGVRVVHRDLGRE